MALRTSCGAAVLGRNDAYIRASIGCCVRTPQDPLTIRLSWRNTWECAKLPAG